MTVRNDCVIFKREDFENIFREDEKLPVKREPVEKYFRRDIIQTIFREAVCNGN